MSSNNIPRLSDSGYRILAEMADSSAHIFTSGNTAQLIEELEQRAQRQDVSPYVDSRINLKVSLDPLNQVDRKGPSTDARNVPILRRAVAGISSEQANQGLFWTSINCFLLSPYISKRWSTKKPTRFVKRHLLWMGKRGRLWNSAARLWWLGEMALRSSEFSIHSSRTLLTVMANNTGLYHAIMDRKFASNPVLVAAIYDTALAGTTYLFYKEHANDLCIKLRAKADTFNVLDYYELYQIVENCLPVIAPGSPR